MKIVICCNKKDFFLTKICVASIRYYYPDVDIYILKDFLNGEFSSEELEKAMHVKVIDLGIKKYGWAASKMHLLLSDAFKGEKILMLDSDVVFVGKFLDQLFFESEKFDFAINADVDNNPYSDFAIKTYYDFKYLKSIDPEFEHPGYFFNTGQMIISSGKLKQTEVIDFFDLNCFPYWKQRDKLPLVDQSLLNYILPKKEQKGEIKILKTKFMMWSESKDAKELDLEKVKQGGVYLSLIHWAGALRIPYINKMSRADILIFFQNFYYQQVPFRQFKKLTGKFLSCLDFYCRRFYHKSKKQLLKN